MKNLEIFLRIPVMLIKNKENNNKNNNNKRKNPMKWKIIIIAIKIIWEMIIRDSGVGLLQVINRIKKRN